MSENNYIVISRKRVCVFNNVSSLPYPSFVSLRKNMLAYVFIDSHSLHLTPYLLEKINLTCRLF